MQLPPLGLYIHLPWCERKCPYCDFNSHETTLIPEREYIAALLQDLREDLALVQGRRIDTIFFGGGTPSLFSPESISDLMQGIAALVPIANQIEATMEANPGSAEADKFLGFRQAGINRLSLGIQSFSDTHLQALGRIHNSDQAHAAIEYAKNAGFDSFNIDLMHGLPHQDSAGAISDLRQALDYRPPHLSWYQLTIEPNTVFHKQPPEIPVEDDLADIQQNGEALLQASNLMQYEVSAYSREKFSCRHNRNYWSFGDYLGIGAGAHSKITQRSGEIIRYARTRQPQDYLQAAAPDRITGLRKLQEEDLVAEFMLNALRLNNGFTLPQFTQRTGLNVNLIAARLDSLQQRELLVNTDGRISATTLGRRFLDSVIGEFFSN